MGPVDMVHAVRPAGGGCDVEVELHAPAPVEALLARTYDPWSGAWLCVWPIARRGSMSA